MGHGGKLEYYSRTVLKVHMQTRKGTCIFQRNYRNGAALPRGLASIIPGRQGLYVSGPKINSRTLTNVNHQYLTVYSRLSGMVVDICRGLVLCLRLNPEAMQRGSSVIAGRKHYLSSKRKQKALLKFYKEAWLR